MKKRPAQKHAVMLEYTLLVCSLLPLLFAASFLVYNFNDTFGEIGISIVQFYQRIVSIISLPFP